MTESNDPYAAVAGPCLQVIGSVLPPHSAIYVAGPLETGREFYANPQSGPARVEQGAIRRTNQDRMARFAAQLRANQPHPVIDPGLLRVREWPNAFYGRFFLEVIEQFVREARFLDGWEYSRGATSEYVHCVRHGIPCSDEQGEAIDRVRAQRLIAATARQVEEFGHDASRFWARIDALADAS